MKEKNHLLGDMGDLGPPKPMGDPGGHVGDGEADDVNVTGHEVEEAKEPEDPGGDKTPHPDGDKGK